MHLTPIAEGSWWDEATRSSLTAGGSSVGPEGTLKSLPLPRKDFEVIAPSQIFFIF